VSQLSKDFADYGYDSDTHVHKITAGADKNINKQIVISTWQSIYKQPKDWFTQFDLVIGDEAHLFKAQSLTSILSKLTDCAYRYGLTGTLDGTQTHKLVLEGLFGRVKQITTTKELIDAGSLAKFRIKALILKHDATLCAENKNNKYQEEIDYLVSSHARNKFIRNLTISLKGNTLVLYQLVEKHGKVLHKMIDESIEDRRLFFVHGGVDGEEREEVRRITEEIVDNVVLNFGDTRISCKENELVLLTDGTTKKAKYITEDDDIDDCWILNKNISIQQEST
jgi:superfamily II DNA or RNA helicase